LLSCRKLCCIKQHTHALSWVCRANSWRLNHLHQHHHHPHQLLCLMQLRQVQVAMVMSAAKKSAAQSLWYEAMLKTLIHYIQTRHSGITAAAVKDKLTTWVPCRSAHTLAFSSCMSFFFHKLAWFACRKNLLHDDASSCCYCQVRSCHTSIS
jgi:hypothetical protein